MQISSLIAYYRKRHLLTLKETAKRFQMSDKTLARLEKSEPVSKSSYQKARVAMGVHTFSNQENAQIKAELNQFFHAILYVNYDEAHALYVRLSERPLEMSHFTTTWWVYLYMYAIHTQTSELDIELIDHECQLLIPWMTPHETELYTMEKAGFYFLKGELSQSIEVGIKSAESSGDDHLRAINLFLLGASGINEVGKIESSMRYLEEAETLFLRFANYKRAIRCQAFEFIGRVHGHRYEEVISYYETLKVHPIQDDNHPQLEAFIDGTLARYYLLSLQPEKALKVLDAIPFKSSINYFLKLVALYETSQWDSLKRHLKAVRTLDEPLNNRIHTELVESISAWITLGDKIKLSQHLETVFFSALNSQDYISIMLISPMAIQALKNAKQYKKAYHLAQKTLHILRANT